jgi:hypothetical protein
LTALVSLAGPIAQLPRRGVVGSSRACPGQKGESSAAPGQIHLQSICPPWPATAPLAGLRSAACFNFTNRARLRLGPVDRRGPCLALLFFRAGSWGRQRDDPPHRRGRPGRCSFPHFPRLVRWAVSKPFAGDLHLRLLFEMSLNLNRPSISPSCLGVTRSTTPTPVGEAERAEIK